MDTAERSMFGENVQDPIWFATLDKDTKAPRAVLVRDGRPDRMIDVSGLKITGDRLVCHVENGHWNLRIDSEGTFASGYRIDQADSILAFLLPSSLNEVGYEDRLFFVEEKIGMDKDGFEAAVARSRSLAEGLPLLFVDWRELG
jgi:hypothetical protein